MAQAKGIDAVFALYEEDVYGQEPASPAGKKPYLKNFKLSPDQKRIDSETLNGLRSRARPGPGNIDVGGSFDCELAPEWMGTLLKHALGQAATTGTGPYVHTITIGDLPVGLLFEKDYGAAIVGAGRVERFKGCRISKADFTFPAQGYCTAAFAVKGASSELAATMLDASLEDNGATPFTGFEVTSLLEGGAALASAAELKFSLDNDLDESIYAIGGGGVRQSLPEGFSGISGTLEAFFDSAGQALVAKAIAGTESSLKVILSRGTGNGSAGNEYLEFLISHLLYERKSPDVDGPKGLKVDLTFKGFRVGADNGMQITIKNAVAAI